MPDFTSVLSRTVGEVERPKTIPAGNYLCVVTEPAKPDKAKNKTTGEEWDVVNFTLKILQPMGDVDMAAYQDAIAKAPPTNMKWTKFVNDERGVYYLQEDLKNIFDVPAGTSFGEALAQCQGKQVIATVKLSPSKDGKSLNANIDALAKAA